MHKLWFLLKTAVLVYAGLCLFMWADQRHLMYHPNTNIHTLQDYRLAGFDDVSLHAPDGTQIDAWHHDATAGFPTIIFYHGNAGNMGSHAAYFDALAKAGFGVLAIDYRGFGKSQGAPDEAGLYADARTALHYATDTLHVPPSQLILYGESLGTGVAVQMATEFHVGALVLQAPYAAIADIGKMRYPWLPVDLLLEDKFDSTAKIDRIHMPLLLMHGTQDNTIPVTEGQMLFARAQEPKQAVYFPGKDHANMDIGARVNALNGFTRKYNLVGAQLQAQHNVLK
ncbi:MAG TPA: alpha/beta hydrolase [Rickettsiales bacterium]|nr:alpha/beta hydrolase [Rickettsiales bacterium]